MKTTNARIEYTPRVRRDVRRLRHFLLRHSGRPLARVREIIDAIRFIQAYPKLSRIEGRSLLGFELRSRKAGRFVIVYSFIEPSTSDPDGVVSIRAIRHASEEDVRFGVEENRSVGSDDESSFLVLK